MSNIQLQLFAAQCNAPTTHLCTPPPAESRTLRERCGWDLTISFAPAVAPAHMMAKGHLGPTIGNLPRRKRSSVVSIDLPAPPSGAHSTHREFFA
ncbi:hypothetical protein R3P38DRAFT_3584904 [Favolaschia claudopus]|uniref:Uncharacterized protein n=1 Tax=Favolaschia claudopus TaxID=2862362 RepID=A0AAW0AL29_9AGAR